MRASISAREVLNAIDPAKLGPNSPLHELLTKKRRAPSSDREHQEQVAIFAWAQANERRIPELALLFAVPNFAGKLGRWTAKHGARLNAEGRKQGIPDIWLPVPRGGYHGFVRELKAPKGRATAQQLIWLNRLADHGWSTGISYGANEFILELEQYLSPPPLPTPTTSRS